MLVFILFEACHASLVNSDFRASFFQTFLC